LAPVGGGSFYLFPLAPEMRWLIVVAALGAVAAANDSAVMETSTMGRYAYASIFYGDFDGYVGTNLLATRVGACRARRCCAVWRCRRDVARSQCL
jgi:hypothetical protein